MAVLINRELLFHLGEEVNQESTKALTAVGHCAIAESLM